MKTYRIIDFILALLLCILFFSKYKLLFQFSAGVIVIYYYFIQKYRNINIFENNKTLNKLSKVFTFGGFAFGVYIIVDSVIKFF